MITKILLLSLSFFILSIQDINPVLYLISFYLLAFIISKHSVSFDINLFTLSILGIILAWTYSFIIAITSGNNPSFALRYSGGLLIVPIYFLLTHCSLQRLTVLLKHIIIVMFTISLVSVIYLAANIFDSASLISPLRLLLGSGSGSGYEDTRYYSLTLVSAVIPSSILLLISPCSLRVFFPKLFRFSFTPITMRLLGVLFGFSSQMLLFSKSYIIYLLFLFIFIICSSSHSILRLRINIGLICTLLLISIVMPFIIHYVFEQIDIQRVYVLLDSFNYESNTQRYDQIEYIFNHFSLSGSGLGASFENTPLLRSHSAPYGLENSWVNLLHKFGISSVLFLPILYVIARCFARISSLKRALYSSSLSSTSQRNSLDVLLILNILLPSFSYFIFFSVGNPILFHIQLNFLFLLIFSIYSIYEDQMKSVHASR